MDEQAMQEMYRLTKENNKMLHKMRRNAFFAGIVKFIFYILILVVAPLWVYSTYLSPVLQNLQQTMAQVQGTNQKAQNMWLQIESKFPSFGRSSNATSTGQ